MAGRRRGRTGRGWDAAPPRPRSRAGGDPSAAEEATKGRGAPQQPDAPAGAPGAPGTAGAFQPPADPAQRAREICLRQLAVRPRTRAELAEALRRAGIDDQVTAEVLDRYDEVGMIDDAAFARAWVTSRHHSRGLARRALGQELRRRGVAAETVDEALAEVDSDTEAATARALVERKLRTATGDPARVARRLVGMLARRGYSAGLAYRVVKEALAADERTTELAEQIDPDLVEEEGDGTGN